MEAQTVDSLPPVAADHDPVRCLLAIELSKKSWIVAITTALSDKISRYTLDGCDWKGAFGADGTGPHARCSRDGPTSGNDLMLRGGL